MSSTKTKTKIYAAFMWSPRNLVLTSPPDYEGRRDYVLNRLRSEFEDIDFVGGELFEDYEELKEAEERDDIDAILAYILHIVAPPGNRWYLRGESEIAPFRKKPMLIVSDPSMLFPAAYPTMPFVNMARKWNLPVLPVAGTKFEDIHQSLGYIEAIHKMKESKILTVGVLDMPEEVLKQPEVRAMMPLAEDRQWTIDREKHLNRLKQVFGTEVISMPGEEFFKDYGSKISDAEAKKLADEWVRDALAVRGPVEREIMEAAKWPPTLKKAVEDAGADAVVINEGSVMMSPTRMLEMRERGMRALSDSRDLMQITPCLAMCTLKDDGIPCSPVLDLDSTVTQLMMLYLTSRAGFVNDTLIDPPRGRIIHSYCCIPRKWEGPDSAAAPYDIRHCCIGGTTIAVDPREHYGKTCTAVKVSILGKLLVTHQGKLAGRISRHVDPEEIGHWDDVREARKMNPGHPFDDIACQNKLVVETDAEKAFENWPLLWDLCGFHRVLYVGDFLKEMKDMGILLGFDHIAEDRDTLAYEYIHRNVYERTP